MLLQNEMLKLHRPVDKVLTENLSGKEGMLCLKHCLNRCNKHKIYLLPTFNALVQFN